MQTTGGASALMYACQQCKEVEVLEILRKQPYSVKDQDRTLKTPLHYCAENPNTSCAEAVLKIAPELVNAQDENGYCTLHLAVIAGNKSLIKLLISKGAEVNIHDNEEHSAVHWAIVSSEKEALEIIIRAGANPTTPDIHGGYPLHYAVQMCGSNGDYSRNFEDTVRVVETLLKFGVDVNVKDKDGRQPILWAASAGSADAVIHLVSGGACVEAADKDGLTALHCAASRGHTATLETLISLCGANVDVIDGNGCSPLFYSVTLGHADATELLLQLGADPNRQDRKGRTPAHCGAAKGQLETLRILKKHNGNLWMRNVKGDIPLHEAVASGRKDLVLWLLSQNSEAINIANNDGRCPLHIASMYNNTEMVKVLLDSKSLVNPVMRTSKGILMTPLNVALCKGHRSCGKYLQLHGGVPFSKVSKVESASVSAVRISPSDDMIIITSEMSKENATSSQSKISKSRSFTDIQGNQKTVKTEAADKKKVYRRRKKKKSSSNISSQDSDSDDSIHNLKIKTADSRKNEKNSENDNGDDEEGNGEVEEKLKLKKVQLDTKAVKQEKSSKNSSIKRKTSSSKKNETSEEAVTVKRITKTKTESKSLQKNKSFNETKNVSDLSPEDFPPLMQTINQLDSVIMEPDVEVSKPENEDNELKSQDTKTVDLSCDIVTDDIKKGKIIEKSDLQSKTISGEILSNGDTNTNLKRAESAEENEKLKKENLGTQEKSVKITAKKPDRDFRKDEIVTKSSESISSNDEDENNIEKSVKYSKSLSRENFFKKDSEIRKKSNDGTEGSDVHEKTEILESDRNGRTPFDTKVNNKSGESSSLIKSDDEINRSDKVKTVPEINDKGFNNNTIKEKSESGNNDLSEEGTNKEVLVKNENEKEKEKSDEKINDLESLPVKEEVFAHVPTMPFEKENTMFPVKTIEKVRTVDENESSVIISEKDEAGVNPVEEKNFTEAKILQVLESPESADTVTEKPEKSSGEVLSEKTEVRNSIDKSDSDESAKKPVRETVEQKENIFHTVGKRFAEIDQNPDAESKLFVGTSNTKEGNDFIRDKTDDSVSKEFVSRYDEGDQILEANYEEPKSGGEGSPQKKTKNSDHRQFKPPKVSRLCRGHRDFKEDMKQISVTQLVQNTIRKYHMERGIFYQLLELKRYQIRSGRANEQVLVKRLADEYEKSRAFLGMKPFSGLYRFREFEKFLYDQLKALNNRRSFIIPEIKSYDDIDALSNFLKKSRYKIISDVPQGKMVCTCITQRCHHSACAYTSVPCSAYNLRRHRHHKPRKECFFPRIDQRPPLKLQTQKFTERPATLELIQGSEKHVIMLPQSSPVRGKRYYVTFTVKGAPAFKKEDFLEDPKDYFKHRHAKSV